jgi:hypothetical protein
MFAKEFPVDDLLLHSPRLFTYTRPMFLKLTCALIFFAVHQEHHIWGRVF